jgi:hypothetical protein
MTALTNEQRDYLEQKGIPLSSLFDATGMATWFWQSRMKELGFGFAFGTKACKRGGHTLRTRKNHCIQCNPQSISHYKRYRQNGYVYIAGSLTTKRIKVGMTTDLVERKKQLNIYRYGGASDWDVLATAWTERAGEVENNTQRLLRPHSISASYVKAGEAITCNEIFSCKFGIARDALELSLGDTKLKILNEQMIRKAY